MPYLHCAFGYVYWSHIVGNIVKKLIQLQFSISLGGKKTKTILNFSKTQCQKKCHQENQIWQSTLIEKCLWTAAADPTEVVILLTKKRPNKFCLMQHLHNVCRNLKSHKFITEGHLTLTPFQRIRHQSIFIAQENLPPCLQIKLVNFGYSSIAHHPCRQSMLKFKL